jgi:AcrR family transcriptional regulator
MRQRLIPADRQDQLIAAALVAATDKGYQTVRRRDIAALVPCSVALVSHYFGSVNEMRRTILAEAIKRGVLPVVAQGLTMRAEVPPHVAARATEWMAQQNV